MAQPCKSLRCSDAPSDAIPDECPTVERPVPLELIQATCEEDAWPDSYPTTSFDVPEDLVAKSVPPQPDIVLGGAAPKPRAAKSNSALDTAWNQVKRQATALVVTFLVTVTLASALIVLVH